MAASLTGELRLQIGQPDVIAQRLASTATECAQAKAEGRYKGRPEDTERNAGIASLLSEGRSWSFIQDMTGCSRATVAKVAKRIAAPAVSLPTAFASETA